jgi:hypothetical protein
MEVSFRVRYEQMCEINIVTGSQAEIYNKKKQLL